MNPTTTGIQQGAKPEVAIIATKTNRLAFIDSLRGLAALYVVAFHMALLPTPKPLMPQWLSPGIVNGASGVTLFFVISAFTLCFTLDGRQSAPHSTYNFYVRRIFRIVPLYYAWMALMVVWTWGLSWATVRAYKVPFLLYMFFGFNFFPGRQEGLVWSSWTLGVEMVFYLAFPFIFRIVNSLRRSFLFLAATGVLSFVHYIVITQHTSWLAQGYVLRYSLFTQLPVFAVGIIVYFIYKRYQSQPLAPAVRRSLLGLGAVGFCVVPYVWPFLRLSPMYDVIMQVCYAMAIVYALLFLGLAFGSDSFLVNRISRFFGNISYSLYLTHTPFVILLAPVYQKIYATGGSITAHFFTCLLITLVPLTMVSYITYRLIEQPFISLARRFSK